MAKSVVRHARRAGLLAIPLMLLSGCEALSAPEIKDCEEQLLRKLKSPASYKRVEAYSLYMSNEKPPEVWVTISYDAANSYNALMRGSERCQYPAKDGKADMLQHRRNEDKAGEQAVRDAEKGLADLARAQKELDRTLSQAARDAADAADDARRQMNKEQRYPYVAAEGVDIRSAKDEENWQKYGTTDPDGGE